MINEHLKKENIFLDDWAAKVSGFIRDGIVDHEFYWKSGIKILFLLKEGRLEKDGPADFLFIYLSSTL